MSTGAIPAPYTAWADDLQLPRAVHARCCPRQASQARRGVRPRHQATKRWLRSWPGACASESTIHAGAQGNAQNIHMSYESWRSRALAIPIYFQLADPRNGERTTFMGS